MLSMFRKEKAPVRWAAALMSDRGFRGAHNDHSLSIRPKEEARKNRASLLESRSRSAARLPALPRCADKTHRANWFRPVRGPFYLEELDAELAKWISQVWALQEGVSASAWGSELLHPHVSACCRTRSREVCHRPNESLTKSVLEPRRNCMTALPSA